MNFNFELILFYAVLISGVLALIDMLFFAKKRKATDKMPLIMDYARSFFPVLLLVFILRSFLYEPFRIPSGSLQPTLLIGDFILVNKFDYGIRLPIVHKKILNVSEPKHGDIIVFRWPPNPSLDFIKRVIGVPGDKISYIDKVLYVNGQKIPQTFIKNTTDRDEEGNIQDVLLKQEDFFGVQHKIYQNLNQSGDDIHDIEVPPGMYFAMGDNRDNSADSRFWGFVPEENIVGKASHVWMSWDSIDHNVRWKRLGHSIH